MSLKEFFEMLEKQCLLQTYIVTLKYKYDHEGSYRTSNEILDVDSNGNYIWLDDWCEGETDIEVIGYIALSDVITTPL